MSAADPIDPAIQAVGVLIQAAVKSGEARSILQETQRVLANAEAELSHTARLVAQAKAAALHAGFVRGVRVGHVTGLICGAVLGGCAAMLLQAVLS